GEQRRDGGEREYIELLDRTSYTNVAPRSRIAYTPRVNTTASGSVAVAAVLPTLMAYRAAWQPSRDSACDRETHGDETVVKVPLRPRPTARCLPPSGGPRGGNAAHVQQR